MSLFVADAWSVRKLEAAHARWAATGLPTSLFEVPWPTPAVGSEPFEVWVADLERANEGEHPADSFDWIELLEYRLDADAWSEEEIAACALLLEAARATDDPLGFLADLSEAGPTCYRRGRLPEVGSPQRAWLVFESREFAPVWDVIHRAANAGGLDRARVVAHTSPYPKPDHVGPCAVVSASETFGVVALQAETDLDHAIRDLELFADASDRAHRGPTWWTTSSRGLCLARLLDVLPVLVRGACEDRDVGVLVRIEALLERFDPVGDLRAAGPVEEAAGCARWRWALEYARDPESAAGESVPEWLRTRGVTRNVAIVARPISTPLGRFHHAGFHGRWREREQRLARAWYEPGSLGTLGDPLDELDEDADVRSVELDWGPWFAFATQLEARRRAALCGVAFARGGEAHLARALDAHPDPFTGEAFERGVREDGLEELRSPGAPPEWAPAPWPLHAWGAR